MKLSINIFVKIFSIESINKSIKKISLVFLCINLALRLENMCLVRALLENSIIDL